MRERIKTSPLGGAIGELLTGQSSRDSVALAQVTIVIVAVAGWLVRLAPLVRHGGVLAAPVDYDEGVHFSAAALLVHGHVPYRDFVLVTPPGLPYLLTPFALLGGPETGFATARVAVTVVGALSIVLVGRLALRHLGPTAAVVAALVYAAYPEAVAQEHAVLREPLLNLLLLAAASLWLSTTVAPSSRRLDWRALGAGLLCGLALGVKLWALLAILACLAALPGRARLSRVAHYLGGIGLTTVVLWVPMFVVAGGSLTHQVFHFQFARPPDGRTSRHERIESIFFRDDGISSAIRSPHFAATLLALAGLAFVLATRARRRLERFAAAWFLVTIAAFVLSRPYYDSYNSFLVPSTALLAGIAATGLLGVLSRLRPAPALAAVATAVLLLAPLSRLPRTIHEGEARDLRLDERRSRHPQSRPSERVPHLVRASLAARGRSTSDRRPRP